MKSSFENKVSGNRDCDIKITNVTGYDDKLAKYNICEEKIENVRQLEKEFSSRETYASNRFNSQLPRELQDDFEVDCQKIGHDVVFVTKPKTKESYQKFPQKINFKFKQKDIKNIQTFKSNKFEDIIKEMYQKQITVEISNIEEIKEYLGDIENPLSIFDKFGSNGTLFISPEPFPDARQYDIEIFNDEFDAKFENTILRTKEIDDGTCILSNYEDTLSHYEITMKLTYLNGNSAKFNLNIKIRNDYLYDFETIREIIKFMELINDKKSRFILKDNLTNTVVFNTDEFGSREIKKSEYKQKKKYIDILSKIIYIEKIKNLKFKYNAEEIVKYIKYIELVYRAVRNENFSINEKTGWIFDFYLEHSGKEIKKIQNNDEISIDIEKLNLLDCNVPINLYRFKFIDYKISSKDELADIIRIKLICSKVCIKLL